MQQSVCKQYKPIYLIDSASMYFVGACVFTTPMLGLVQPDQIFSTHRQTPRPIDIGHNGVILTSCSMHSDTEEVEFAMMSFSTDYQL